MSAPHTILVVEDNALVAKFYKMALERAGGFRCIVTEDVKEMLKHIEASEVDLAILDVSLSDTQWEGRRLDGLELTHILKRHSPRKLPVLLATAHAMAGDRERMLADSGADGYLEKPIYEADVLVGMVRGLLADP